MAIESGKGSNLDGLRTALDIVVAPKDALQRLRDRPTWGWALLIVVVLYALASWAMAPALVHATQADWPNVVAKNAQLAAESPSQQQTHLALTLKIVGLSWIATPLIVLFGVFLQALILTICNMAGRGTAPFRKLWALAVNIAIPLIALNTIVTAIIVLVRGPQAFDSALALQTVMPSLGYLVPATSLKLHTFLTFINPFTLWGTGLIVAGMAIVAGVSRAWAWSTGIVWLLINGLLVALLAR
ncbi:MAG TPA: YIP1 family protein [Candidatus Tumulicola sp.]